MIVITGASAGIGRALAIQLHADGACLVLAARRIDKLDALNAELGGKHLCVRCDVAERGDCDALVAAAVERFGRIDTLVCNAGYGFVRRVHEMTDDEHLAMYRANVLGTTMPIRAAVPVLRRNDVADGWRGQVVIVSSAAARRGLPFFGVYSATKAAQLSLAEAMRVELAGDRIAVTSVHPIGTDTDFFSTAEKGSGAVIDTPGRGWAKQSVGHVARAIVAGIARPRPEVWPSRPSRWALALAATMPRLTDVVMRRQARSIERAQAGVSAPAAGRADA